MNILFTSLLFLILLILLIPRPVLWTLKRLSPVLLLGIFAVVGVVLLRSSTPTVTVTALDQKNEGAEATEIWLKSVVVNGEETPAQNFFKGGEWLADESYLKWRSYDQNAFTHRTIKAEIADAETIQLVFDASKWRGIVRIETELGSIDFDTYDPNDAPGTKTVSCSIDMPAYFRNFSSEKVLLLVILLLTLLAAVSIGISFLHRKKQGLSSYDTVDYAGDRALWLDLLKIMSGFFIVMIHVVGDGFHHSYGTAAWGGYLFLNVIPRFAVPVFMMVSGVLLLGRDVPFVKAAKKAGRTCMLLVGWNLFYMMLSRGFWGSGESVWHQIMAIPVKRQFSGHLWYLYFLVWMYLFSPLLSAFYRSLSKKHRLYFVVLTLGVPGVLDLYNSWFSFGGASALESFQLYMVPSYAGLMVLGRLIYDEISTIHHARLIALGMAIVGFGGTLLLTLRFSVIHGYPAELFLSENKLFPVIFAVGVFGLVSSWDGVLQRLPTGGKKFLVRLSKNALGLYLFHCTVLWLLPGLTVSGIELSPANGALQALGFCIIYYVISVYCVSAMSKIPIIREFVM